MKRVKTAVALLLCLVFLLTLTGCESENLKKAKECVDKILEYSNELAPIELRLSQYTPGGDYSDAELLEWAELEREQTLLNDFLESRYETLDKLLPKLSEKERRELEDYVNEVFADSLIDIWSR